MITTRKGEWIEFVIPPDWQGHSIERLLKETWGVPKRLMHQFRIEKGVKLNGQVIPWHTLLQKNDRLQLWLYKPEHLDIVPQYRELEILWEDEHLLVINKEAGIDVHPTEQTKTETLTNAVAFYLQSQGIFTKVRHIHRLDRDTSGAILFAKHALAGAMLDRMLEQRKIKRTYVALVHGIVKKKTGTIAAPIGRDRHHPTRRRVSKTGASAVTHYRVLDPSFQQQTSLVELSLDKGRTHQIRVHMSYIGHPLVGDTLYGGSSEQAQRQALHAVKLSFSHPFTNDPITCIAPVRDNVFPKDITRFY